MAALLLGFSFSASAQDASAKGMATVNFTPPLTGATKQAALQKAQVNALDRYFSTVDQAKAKNYELIRGRLLESIDSYILGATILSEEVDDKAGVYTVTVRADINKPRLENALQGSSAMANTANADKSALTFVFIARQQRSVQAFDDKVYKRVDTQSSAKQSGSSQNRAVESERIRSASIETGESVKSSGNFEASSSDSVTTGGSVTKKADVVEWSIVNADGINSVMTGTFSNAGYEVVEAEYLEQASNNQLSVAAIRKDYSTGNDLSAATLRSAVSGVKAAEVPYLAYGTLDVGMADTDPASGLTRVYVTVSGKVLDLRGRFPKTASAVGPVQFAGLGPNEGVARTNALKSAAGSAAQQLMNEMNARGVQ
ncbi:hypothetical protein [Solimonas sp. SE-A11]|uniref:hypothetical protein n=1 Tax=Solimonas sp. SE-A11 TaxID=3054954 RepID=UPI00259C7CB3|nr:hypothetical protein [Solimonas sp. SE-A11]MDM4772960.1 hypothetical protein [Solimonas sp. SE-A11]